MFYLLEQVPTWWTQWHSHERDNTVL